MLSAVGPEESSGGATCEFLEHLLGVRCHSFGQGHRWVRWTWALIPALLLATWPWPGICLALAIVSSSVRWGYLYPLASALREVTCETLSMMPDTQLFPLIFLTTLLEEC